ncbi:DUF2007 domain-containing protein [Zeaxanthinibacter sp. PT1]|uniref:DUF2007 domain-containing protein n=1 Tax=Zeaxanthinibacter TaxID=561554 RepID=UPI001800D178|nr:DUF2007 domain-containing protein [Zeaxanthinibacter sp. PT1]MDC6351061.1 DUF2007 domain-containing protein [Zeaxanthinibacter sp. PT1]NNF18388.1 DUF2007 domain-containing protein [Flavobacteriaceae bacterium]
MSDRLITIGTFEYVADVQIVKAKLEYEGIPVFLKDETILATDPLISAAIGGVKLQVYSSDRERALEIYDEIRSYAKDEEGNPVTCPNCKAQRSEVYYSRKKILHRLFPFLEPVKYRCLKCQMITKPNP